MNDLDIHPWDEDKMSKQEEKDFFALKPPSSDQEEIEMLVIDRGDYERQVSESVERIKQEHVWIENLEEKIALIDDRLSKLQHGK